MTDSNRTLVRSLGRWTLVGLMLNGILGSGVYGLPSVIAGRVGGAAWWAWVMAAVAIGVIMLCVAEVASRFTGAGGPYLYARTAFGPFVGVQMGWLSYLVRLTATATNANLFVIYLAEFVPAVSQPGVGTAVLVLLFGTLAAVNYVGVRQGAVMSNVLILAKIIPLVLFGVIGLALVAGRGAVEPVAVATPTTGTWIEVLLLLIFAYGGFEASLVPLGEARNPRRDAPFALLMALGACAVLYTSVQLVTSLALSDPAAHSRPLSAAAGALVGPAGASFMAVGALLSLYGYFAASMINVPRLSYAMADQGDIPRIFAKIDPKYRTPGVSIVAYAAFSLMLALSGSFLQNLTLSAVSRLATYGLICLALPVFRRREGSDPAVGEASFRLPAGGLFAALGVGVTLLLATRMTMREGLILSVVVVLATAIWQLTRRTRPLAG
ncbi:MAG: APC family permease [Gemmatimonadales bacterium]|nr:APC family permease [Gemmatimonadales bacterium]